jgi:hypothetical protein
MSLMNDIKKLCVKYKINPLDYKDGNNNIDVKKLLDSLENKGIKQ